MADNILFSTQAKTVAVTLVIPGDRAIKAIHEFQNLLDGYGAAQHPAVTDIADALTAAIPHEEWRDE